MSSDKLQMKPAVLHLKWIKHISKIPLTTVYSGTGQAVVMPIIREGWTLRLGNKMIYGAAS